MACDSRQQPEGSTSHMAEEYVGRILTQMKRLEDALARKCWKQLFEEDVFAGFDTYTSWDQDIFASSIEVDPIGVPEETRTPENELL